MVQLGEVDRRRRRIQLVQAEFLDQVAHGEELGVVVVAPAHQGDPVDHAFGDIAQLPQVFDKDRIAVLA